MPIYEYRCPNGHTFEVFQRMSDPPVSVCETCGAGPVE
jgi:putative FmdB family regulatory protein